MAAPCTSAAMHARRRKEGCHREREEEIERQRQIERERERKEISQSSCNQMRWQERSTLFYVAGGRCASDDQIRSVCASDDQIRSECASDDQINSECASDDHSFAYVMEHVDRWLKCLLIDCNDA